MMSLPRSLVASLTQYSKQCEQEPLIEMLLPQQQQPVSRGLCAEVNGRISLSSSLNRSDSYALAAREMRASAGLHYSGGGTRAIYQPHFSLVFFFFFCLLMHASPGCELLELLESREEEKS